LSVGYETSLYVWCTVRGELNPMRCVNLIPAARWPLMGIADARHIAKYNHKRTFVEAERKIEIIGVKEE
jgi:hypothetical protein